MNESVWLEKMGNLMKRRASGNSARSSTNDLIGNYQRHLSKCKIGLSVLDVGCGDQTVKKYLAPGVKYIGIDPFPSVPEAKRMKIEDCSYPNKCFDTVICFAVLDGVHDLEKALVQISRVAAMNIIILTGVDIPVDQYHTYEINELQIDNFLPEFQKTYREELGSKKVLLLEYSRL